MGGEWSTYGRIDVYTVFWCRNLRKRDDLEDPGVDGRIILRLIFTKCDGTWTGLIWLITERQVAGICECGNEASGSKRMLSVS